MKRFIKVFFLTFFICSFALVGIIYTYFKMFDPLDEEIHDKKAISNIVDLDIEKQDKDGLTPFKRALMNSNRINTLVIGLEEIRTDTILFVSFDRDTKKTDLISIPRDTYYKRDRYKDVTMYKINAIYQSEGVAGLKKAIKEILNVPIHRYVIVDYNAVVKSVDMLGGIGIDIPYKMSYHDEYDVNPLSIEFEPGYKLLNGKEALEFLRFRQNDDGSHRIYDIGRMKNQQMFLKSMLKKALSFKLPSILKQIYPFIETDYSVTEIVSLASDLVGFSTDKLDMCTMPNKPCSVKGISFVKKDEEEILKIIYKMYNVVQ